MQKVFYVCTNMTRALIEVDLKIVNEYIGKKGKIISITPCRASGKDNTIDWLIVADNENEDLKI